MGDHAGRPVQQGLARRAGAGDRTGGARQPRAHLGPAELRRVGRVLHRTVRVRDAGRRPGRPAGRPRHGARRDRRRVRRLPGVAAHRGPSPRCRGRPGHVVDQRGNLRPDGPGCPLLRRIAHGRVERRHGGRREAARVGGGAQPEPRQPAEVPRPGPPGVHSRDGTLDGGVLSVRGRTRPRPAGHRGPAARRSGPRVPERRERLQSHPRDVRAAGPAAAERPARRAALGGRRMERALGRAPRGKQRGPVRGLAAPGPGVARLGGRDRLSVWRGDPQSD